jgi:hypothetical protein
MEKVAPVLQDTGAGSQHVSRTHSMATSCERRQKTDNVLFNVNVTCPRVKSIVRV